jgi:5-(carboxyamino)imidazole ribonucleotide synthase
MTDSPSSPAEGGFCVGVVGGGQLGRMLGLAGIPLGMRFIFLDPAPDACAAVAGPLQQAAFDDLEAVRELAGRADVATFDFENVPETSADAIAEIVPVYPPPRALGAGQDRLAEKNLLVELGIAVPEYHAVRGRTDLLDGLDRLGYPAVLKTRRLGYDGKGQSMLRDPEDLERAWQRLGEAPLVLEDFVPFEAECSLIGVRGGDGATRFWPLTRNVHADGILALSQPGVCGPELQAGAERIMQRLMDHLEYRGVLTIEFFLRDGRLLVNEFAPRVHNSGHWTIDGSTCSQFENHLRAIAELPLGSTDMRAPSLMFNWIGEMPTQAMAMAIPGLHWHDYGKAPRPGRKIGHATLTAESGDTLRDRAVTLAAVAGGEFPDLLETLFTEIP